VPASIIPPHLDGHVLRPDPPIRSPLAVYTRTRPDPLTTAFTEVLTRTTLGCRSKCGNGYACHRAMRSARPVRADPWARPPSRLSAPPPDPTPPGRRPRRGEERESSAARADASAPGSCYGASASGKAAPELEHLHTDAACGSPSVRRKYSAIGAGMCAPTTRGLVNPSAHLRQAGRRALGRKLGLSAASRQPSCMPMQVKPIAGCGWKWFYQQLQSLHAARDGPISPPACSPSCSPTSRLPPPPGGAGLVGCYSPHYCQAA